MERRSTFASLLEGMEADDAAADRTARGFVSFDHLGFAETLKGSATPVPGDVAAAAYESVSAFDAVEFAESFPEQAAPEPMGQAPVFREQASREPVGAPVAAPLVQPPVDPAAIAGELGLGGLDAAGIAQARRSFASLNHPDRVPPAIRAAALRRMQIANALVDEAEKRLGGAARQAALA